MQIKRFIRFKISLYCDAMIHYRCGIILAFDLQGRNMAKRDAGGLERRPEHPEGLCIHIKDRLDPVLC